MDQFDTITAISTGAGGGIGIVRVSGKEAVQILKQIFKAKKPCREYKSHRLYYGNIYDGQTIVDEVLAAVMRAPNSYTCEDVVEINCHGGANAVRLVLELVLRKGARLAEPGEFTKRAFLNGRIDLNQAEAVIDLINAKTDVAQKAAAKRLQGTLSKKVKETREGLLDMLALIQVSIDYPEHEMEEDNISDIQSRLEKIIGDLGLILKNAGSGIILKEGIETAIVGRPNVGKSSLLNTILDEDRAIVTDIPGTTRDILQEYVNIEGIPLKIIDTAGIRHTEDIVEMAGVQRSRALIANAGLVLMMLDGSAPLTDGDKALVQSIDHKNAIIIVNKTDLFQGMDRAELQLIAGEIPVIDMSVKKGSGIEALYRQIKGMFFEGALDTGQDYLVGNVRTKNLLEKALSSLNDALRTARDGIGEDFVAVGLTEAYGLLGEIIGETVGEDVIDRIFSQFCLGK